MDAPKPDGMVMHAGGCHCGRVRFEAEAPAAITVTDCNCSICSKTGYLHLIVPKSCFKLVQGEEFLTSYRFNTGAAQHLFCKVCGIRSFYVAQSFSRERDRRLPGPTTLRARLAPHHLA